MKQLKINNIINKILIIFLIIQPIFDIKIFYNSISTLIRVIIISALFAYYFFTSKNKNKYYLLIYPLLLVVYFIFHHINASSFNSLVPGDFNYSILKEALYFVKMISPFLLIYCLYKSKISSYDIIRIMKYLCIIISLLIIVSNLLGFSYGNYSDVKIKANFFEWFNPTSSYTYMDLASKGLFEFGNQIGAILIMFLPFMIYSYIQHVNLKNWTIVLFNVFALILLCTRVSVFGIVIVFVYTIFAFVFIGLIKKQSCKIKKYIPIGIILLIYSLLLPINPMFNRLNERATVIENFGKNSTDSYNEQEIINSVSEDVDLNIKNESSVDLNTPLPPENSATSNNTSYDYMINFIEENYEPKQLNEQFLFINYPYKYDPEFWYNFLQNDISLTTDYRYIETSIIKRVVEINNNPMDIFFGITNVRLQNIFNIERDFVVQYYALGIIGTILVFAPYFILLGIFVYKYFIFLHKQGLFANADTNLNNKKFKNLNIINLLAAITIVFLFGIAYMSGNLLNSLSFTIYFTLAFCLLIKNSPSSTMKDCS